MLTIDLHKKILQSTIQQGEAALAAKYEKFREAIRDVVEAIDEQIAFTYPPYKSFSFSVN